MVNLFVYDNQLTYREGVKHLLEIKIPKCKVEVFGDIDKKELQTMDSFPDLVIVDPTFGYEKTLRIIDFYVENGVKVVLLSSYEKDREKVLTLLQKNISGYLVKTMETTDLLKYLKTILNGGRYIHPIVANVLLDFFRTSNRAQSKGVMGNKKVVTI
ncbi:hypothetical protein [Ferdinandcohnia sp. SAFN-114]|uniref:hypothetical protein n=1 Tax=Ferdinandcohnia sp. SAFN-114 TaxID=3387275 RepID=UPI003F7E5938